MRELGVDRGDHDVEPLEQVVVLVEGAVDEDVDLDAGEDPERCQLLVERGDLVELGEQPIAVEAVGDGEARRVVGHHQVLVAQGHGGRGPWSRWRRRRRSRWSGLWQSPLMAAAELGAFAEGDLGRRPRVG